VAASYTIFYKILQVLEVILIDLINTKENRQLLYKYLSKFYGSDKAKELMRKHKNNLFGFNGLAYSLGKRSIEFFCLYFLQDTFVPKPTNEARQLGDFHFEIWDTLESMFIKDEFDKLELIMPRGASKSTTVNFALSVWAHAYQISKYTLVAGKREQDAINFILETRRAFEENPYILHTFGKLIDTKRFTVNKLEIELANKTKIEAISSASSMRGRKYSGGSSSVRPQIIIADDYQSLSDVITQEARDKKYNTWTQDALYAGDKAVYRNGKKIKMATKFIVLGTILHRDCFMSRLLKDSSYKHIVKRAILVDDVDKLFNTGLWAEFKKIYFNSQDPHRIENAKEFYYQNENEMKYPVLWEDKYDCLDLALDYYENPQAFKQEMQNDASKIGEKAFHQITSKPREEIEKQEFVKTILCCDPAVETKENNDYTALLVGSITSNQFRWVRKGIIKRMNFDDYVNQVIELLKEYPDITHIWIEKNTYNGADVREIQKKIESDKELSHRKIEIINERQHKNKEAKIRAISGKIDSGFIIFAEEDKEFTDQILSYEGEKFTLFDDAADITAEFDRLIDEIEIRKEIKSIPRGWLF
jgi:predicted phage terminase large subunit-like protein